VARKYPAPASHDPTRRERETRNPLALFLAARPRPFPPFPFPFRSTHLRAPLAAASGDLKRAAPASVSNPKFSLKISLAFATAQTNKFPFHFASPPPEISLAPNQTNLPSPSNLTQVSRPPAPTGRLTYPAGAEPYSAAASLFIPMAEQDGAAGQSPLDSAPVRLAAF